VLTLAAFAVLSVAVASGCSSGQEAAPAATVPPPAGAATRSGVAIDFRSEPDPPASGDNRIEVTLRQNDGTAITDATVMAVFSMPAMPAMNMPAMRAEAPLTHVEGGRYRGTGQLSMGGTWNVSVTARRGGEPIGRRNFSIVAK
jgi:nitrogen fixation protein FixH